jgi:hypothetical protein
MIRQNVMEGSSRQENFFNNIVQSGGGLLLAGVAIDTGGGDVIFGILRSTSVPFCLGASTNHARDKERKVRPQPTLEVTMLIHPFDLSPTTCHGLGFIRRFGDNYTIR